MSNVRPAAVAGLFYPSDPLELQQTVQRFLDDAGEPRNLPDSRQPRALIVPHAGYLYSGHVAGQVYRRLINCSHAIRRVLLLGPSHRVPLKGIAVPRWQRFALPGGEVLLDREGIDLVASCEGVVEADQPHALEHALEVQLPFLNAILDRYTLVPLVVGEVPPELVAAVIDTVVGQDGTLVVVSSDLSHYHSWRDAQQRDQDTVDLILQLEGHLRGAQACGSYAINGLLQVAAQRGWKPELVALENSGDTAGSRDRVVGYGGFAFY